MVCFYSGVDTIHGAIKKITTGDKINLDVQANGIFIMNAEGHKIGKMAGRYSIADGLELVSAHVYAVISHSRALTDVEYQNNVRCNRWEVVVPEFVYRKKMNS